MEQQQKRVWYLEYLRVIATIAVVLLHVAAQNWFSVKIDSYEWKVFNIADSLVRWCVPIFIMISGALFLDNDRPLPLAKLYGKKIVRLITTFLFWSGLFALVMLWEGSAPKAVIKSFITGPGYLWFLFMLAGLYAIAPCLRKMTESMKITEYFLILCFIITVFLPRITALLRILRVPHISFLLECYNEIMMDVALNFTLGYSGYFVLGYYLSKKELGAGIRKLMYAAGVVATVATIWLTDWYSARLGTQSSHFYAYLSINVVSMSAALFVFVRYALAKRSPKEWTARIITGISKHSFGIYLVHYLVLKVLNSVFKLNSRSGDPVLCVVGLTILIFVISYVISVILNKIPVLKKYIV